MTRNRTAIDYGTEGELEQALLPHPSAASALSQEEDDTTAATASHHSSSPQQANPNEPLELEKTQQWDWTIENALNDYDIQSVSREVQRLLTLKSYMALEFQHMELGSPTRTTFHQLGCLAKVACNGAAGLITLVDLGRQWFLANSENIENPGETPRKNGFCAHAILCKERTFVVKDATKDERFVDHFLVTDHGLRFYAGVPLITPEGCKIGALCITDGQPRPQGLSAAEEEQLHLLAKLAMNALVNHRTLSNQRNQLEQAARTSAATVHNLVTPLTGAQLALSILVEDEELQSKMNPKQKDCLAMAQSCTASVQESCSDLRHNKSSGGSSSGTTSISSHLMKHNKKLKKQGSNDTATTASMRTADEEQNLDAAAQEEDSSSSSEATASCQHLTQYEEEDQQGDSEVDLTKMIERLQAVLPTAASSLQVPVTISVDPKLQKRSQQDSIPTLPEEADDADDALEEAAAVPAPAAQATQGDIFRAALCLLTNACTRAAATGSAGGAGVVRLEIRSGPSHSSHSEYLIVESTDTGPEPKGYEYDQMQEEKIQEADIGEADFIKNNKEVVQPYADLQEVARRVRSIGGRGGIRSRISLSQCKAQVDDTSVTSINHTTHSFFFEIPLLGLSIKTHHNNLLEEDQQCQSSSSPRKGRSSRKQGTTAPSSARGCGIGRPSSLSPLRRSVTLPEGPAIKSEKGCRRALVIDDSGIIRKMLSNALMRLGYDQVIQACNGAEGVHCLQKNVAYEVVFCDFLMPVMDGLDCIRTYREWERKHRPGYHQYIVGISAHASLEDVQRAKELGMDDYRDKPLKFHDIKALIEQVAGHRHSNLEILPLLAEDREEVATASEPLAASKKLSCLVITAHEDMRSRMKESISALQEEKIVHTSFAENSKDGLDLLQSRNWTIVLVHDAIDGGMECVKKFRSWEKLNRVRRQHNVHLLMTTSTTQNNFETAVQLPTGIDSAVWGPFGDKRLHPVLMTALKSSREGIESESNDQIRPQDLVTRG